MNFGPPVTLIRILAEIHPRTWVSLVLDPPGHFVVIITHKINIVVIPFRDT